MPHVFYNQRTKNYVFVVNENIRIYNYVVHIKSEKRKKTTMYVNIFFKQ